MTLSCKKLYRLAVIKLDSYSKCRVKLYYRESIKMSCCMYQDMNWKLYRLAVIQLGSHNNCTEESSCIAASQSKCLAVPEHELETVFPRVNQNVLLYQSMSWKLYRLAVIQLDSYNNWKSQAVLQLVNLDIAESLRLFVFNNERFTLWSRSLVSSTSLRKNTLFLSEEPSAFSISPPVGLSAIESNPLPLEAFLVFCPALRVRFLLWMPISFVLGMVTRLRRSASKFPALISSRRRHKIL